MKLPVYSQPEIEQLSLKLRKETWEILEQFPALSFRELLKKASIEVPELKIENSDCSEHLKASCIQALHHATELIRPEGSHTRILEVAKTLSTGKVFSASLLKDFCLEIWGGRPLVA